MLGLIQRVSAASVSIKGEVAGQIGPGLLLLLGVERDDDTARAERLLDKVLAYRVFGDEAGHMNLSLTDTGGGLLIVSQFTLAASTKKGLRPSFSSAAPPAEAEMLYEHFVSKAKDRHQPVATGRFGADMQVALTNDGPVTFLLSV